MFKKARTKNNCRSGWGETKGKTGRRSRRCRQGRKQGDATPVPQRGSLERTSRIDANIMVGAKTVWNKKR